ncbi:MAG: hypothetical protein FWB79_06670 [Treponema sp.]|nr:hypothetical protein [Treponema sp.]
MWHPFVPKNAEWYRWRLNGAAAYIRRDRDSWQIAFRTIPLGELDDEIGGPETAPPPEDLPIIRAWGDGEKVFLHPYLYGKSYILAMGEKLRISPGQQCRFNVALPPVLKFELEPGRVLAEETPFTLSKTFFGPDTMHGEICHSLPAFPGDDTAASRATALIRCEVVLTNKTRTMLEPERIEVNPGPLSVYVRDDRLVTDTLEIEFMEADCRLKIGKAKNREQRLVSAGVKYKAGETFARKSMDIIKDITAI